LEQHVTFIAAILGHSSVGRSGPAFGYSDTWQLIINTGTTIITFLMVVPDPEHSKPGHHGDSAQAGLLSARTRTPRTA
jgi:hypothetical protein